MAQRHIHYEAAFEDYLRMRRWPYIPVNEQKKAVLSGARVKSFDFIVYKPGRPAWLADVKGRKFPYEGTHGKRFWENWVTLEDLQGLHEWEGAFGEGFEPVFVFAYWLIGSSIASSTAPLYFFRNRYYSFACVSAGAYAAYARTRSPKWRTVSVSGRNFRNLIRPIEEA